MNHVLIFRGLIILFVCTYVAAMTLGGPPPDAPAAVLDYQRWLLAQPAPENFWGLTCAVGHLLDVVGLLLLFVRRRLGLWFLLAGFASCFGTGAGAGFPNLQTHLEGQMMAFVNIFWGALVCMAIVCSKELFGHAKES